MIQMTRKNIQVGGALCALLTCFCMWCFSSDVKPQPFANTGKLQANEMARASSLSMERKFGDVLCTFAVDSVTLQQKKVRFLSIGGSRELVVTGFNMRVEIPAGSVVPAYNPFREINEMGLGKRAGGIEDVVSIHGVTITICFGDVVTSIVGRQAVFDVKKNEIRIKNGAWKRGDTVLFTGTFAVPAFLNEVV